MELHVLHELLLGSPHLVCISPWPPDSLRPHPRLPSPSSAPPQPLYPTPHLVQIQRAQGKLVTDPIPVFESAREPSLQPQKRRLCPAPPPAHRDIPSYGLTLGTTGLLLPVPLLTSSCFSRKYDLTDVPNLKMTTQ